MKIIIFKIHLTIKSNNQYFIVFVLEKSGFQPPYNIENGMVC
jgi:hypothetical protein